MSLLDDEWLSTDQLCKITGHAKNTIEGQRSRGKTYGLAHYVVAGKVRYRRSEVEAWLKSCRRGAESDAQPA